MKNLENLKLQELTIGEQVNTSGGCLIKIFFGGWYPIKVKDEGFYKREYGRKNFGK